MGKKITKVGDSGSTADLSAKQFEASPESKKRALNLRIGAALLWVLAIAAQVGAIALLAKKPLPMAWIIVLIVVDLALAILGSILWKKSNRLDPASEKRKFLFFMQNQLGMVVAVIAFLPLVIAILSNKDIDKKQKGILGAVAIGALVIAGLLGLDFNPPSIEKYSDEINKVEELMGKNEVFWTKSGTKYHLYEDCHTINKDVTTEIFEGSVQQARELKNITELCKVCENRSIKLKESAQKEEESKEPEAAQTTDN